MERLAQLVIVLVVQATFHLGGRLCTDPAGRGWVWLYGHRLTDEFNSKPLNN